MPEFCPAQHQLQLQVQDTVSQCLSAECSRVIEPSLKGVILSDI